jgi:hypothetical protein
VVETIMDIDDPFRDEDEDPFADEDEELKPDVDDASEMATLIQVNVLDRDRFPDLYCVKSVGLWEGPRKKREAKYTTVLDRNTYAIHHHELTIQTHRKLKGQLEPEPERSVTLSTRGVDEIERLLRFLHTAHYGSLPNADGRYLVIPAAAAQREARTLQTLINNLAAPESIGAFADFLDRVAKDPSLLNVLLERATRGPELFAEAAAALNIATYKRIVKQLKSLIDADPAVPEGRFQDLLKEHPWMFGSEYSELLERRHWTRNEQQDFVVRRTTDNYIELIEIKTPLSGTDLFNYDRSHKSRYPGAELSKVVGQVLNYIEKLDADRHAIRAVDGEDTCKIRAKIVIGRDGDEHQRAALRRYNGHLHRVEVLTFDQLLRIADRVVSYLESVLRPT